MSAPSVSWRTRVRRTAGSLGAAVVMAGVVPALANAAGADVANPVAIALRASGETISSALGTSGDATTTACATPTAPPEVTVSAEPVDPTESVTPVDPTASVTPVDPTESVTPVEPTASVEPVEPTASVEPSKAQDEECETPEATPSVTESETPDAEESEAAEKPAGHGAIVSTVAKCAPRGKDPLLDVGGAPANHGGYVRPAAHGETVTTPWGAFDLSTQAGADALCAAVDAARAELPETGDEKAKRDKAERAKKARDTKHGKPEKAARDNGAKGTGRPGS